MLDDKIGNTLKLLRHVKKLFLFAKKVLFITSSNATEKALEKLSIVSIIVSYGLDTIWSHERQWNKPSWCFFLHDVLTWKLRFYGKQPLKAKNSIIFEEWSKGERGSGFLTCFCVMSAYLIDLTSLPFHRTRKNFHVYLKSDLSDKFFISFKTVS